MLIDDTGKMIYLEKCVDNGDFALKILYDAEEKKAIYIRLTEKQTRLMVNEFQTLINKWRV